tara:strand:- start:1231 stop:1398 length:168 start_codon:yes stop_codon:yes gene_type:complete
LKIFRKLKEVEEILKVTCMKIIKNEANIHNLKNESFSNSAYKNNVLINTDKDRIA